MQWVRIIVELTLFSDKWTIEVLDVEAAFLEGEMERSIVFVKWPAGVAHLGFITEEEQESLCIKQLKLMHGSS